MAKLGGKRAWTSVHSVGAAESDPLIFASRGACKLHVTGADLTCRATWDTVCSESVVYLKFTLGLRAAAYLGGVPKATLATSQDS